MSSLFVSTLFAPNDVDAGETGCGWIRGFEPLAEPAQMGSELRRMFFDAVTWLVDELQIDDSRDRSLRRRSPETLLRARVGVGRFVIRATRERGVGVPSSRSLATASREANSL
jgi:hypothetical protein